MFTAGMASGMAAYKIQELVREAETQRLSSSVRAAHAGPEGTTVSRLTHGVVAAGRFFHLARREVRQELREPRLTAQAR